MKEISLIHESLLAIADTVQYVEQSEDPELILDVLDTISASLEKLKDNIYMFTTAMRFRKVGSALIDYETQYGRHKSSAYHSEALLSLLKEFQETGNNELLKVAKKEARAAYLRLNQEMDREAHG